MKPPRLALPAVLVLLTAVPALAEPLSLVKGGKPAATIVVPDKADKWTTMPAGWLRDYVEKATGAELQVVPESKAPQGSLIAIGNTRLAWEAGVDLTGLQYDACRIAVRGNALFLRGIDRAAPEPRPYYGPKGTCRAVVVFLERFLGVRWLTPTPGGEYVPRAADLSVPRDTDVKDTPAFAVVQNLATYSPDSPAAYAHNMRVAVVEKSYGGHSFYDAAPAREHFPNHPEYFALCNGRRSHDGNHLCLANAAVRRLVLAEARKHLNAGFDWVAVGQEDAFKRCECPHCEALDSHHFDWFTPKPAGCETYREALLRHPCERLHLLFRWVAEECLKSHPDKKVLLLAYGPTVVPSKEFVSYPPNVIIELANITPESMALWQGRAKGMTCFRYDLDVTLHGGFGVTVTPKSMAQLTRRLHDHGVLKINYNMTPNWGFEGPAYYTEARLLGDPTLEERELVREYCRCLYGAASQPMEDFFELLYSHDEILELKGEEPDRYLYLYPPLYLDRLERFLRRAEADADSAPARQWVKLTRDVFDYTAKLAGVLFAYRAYQSAPTDAAWAVVRDKVNRFDSWREKVLQYDRDYTRRWFPGYRYFANFLTGKGNGAIYYKSWYARKEEVFREGVRGMAIGYGGSAIRMPFVLDLTRPPIAEPVVVRRAAQAPTVDGALDDPAWRAASTHALHNMDSAGNKLGTAFRALYDGQHLYIAWECEEPLVEHMRIAEVGPDGHVWRRECVEFFLDTEGTRKRYSHFMAAPQRNSFYDERCGYSGSGSWDKSWNPKWTYAYKIEKDKNRWTLEMRIPFNQLGARPPSPGTEWQGNFGRERIAQHRDKNSHAPIPEVYIWSQNEAEGLNTPLNFGVIRFE